MPRIRKENSATFIPQPPLRAPELETPKSLRSADMARLAAHIEI